MPLFNEKRNDAMCAVVEDTFGDAFKVTAMDFEDEDVITDFYKIFLHVFKEPIDSRRISDISIQGTSIAV